MKLVQETIDNPPFMYWLQQNPAERPLHGNPSRVLPQIEK
jgi:hypothetical protein